MRMASFHLLNTKLTRTVIFLTFRVKPPTFPNTFSSPLLSIVVNYELQSIILRQQIISMAASLNMSLQLEPSLSSSNSQALPLPPWAWNSCEKDEDISGNVLITPYLQITPSLLNVALIHKLSTHFLSLHSVLTRYSFSLLITLLRILPGFSFSRSFFLSLTVFFIHLPQMWCDHRTQSSCSSVYLMTLV